MNIRTSEDGKRIIIDGKSYELHRGEDKSKLKDEWYEWYNM